MDQKSQETVPHQGQPAGGFYAPENNYAAQAPQAPNVAPAAPDHTAPAHTEPAYNPPTYVPQPPAEHTAPTSTAPASTEHAPLTYAAPPAAEYAVPAGAGLPPTNAPQPETVQQYPADVKRPVPETPPAYPPRPSEQAGTTSFPPPPTRNTTTNFGADDPSSPVHYVRDPHKLVAYLVPFPKPDMHKHLFHKADAKDIPERFLIYTPPPPPLKAPAEGEKESKFHKVQRKWQEEVRSAKADESKVASWKGLKSRATKGINVAMAWTTTSNLDFLNRVPGNKASSGSRPVSPNTAGDKHADDGVAEEETTKRTVGLEEMVLIYPQALPGTEAQIREEFVNTMLRSKSKAQRDSVIATGLLPVGFAIDVLATLVWPFGGLAEIDSVWLYSSIRGAKTARSVTKRLNSSSPDAAESEAKLKLTFTPSPRLDILQAYLASECHTRDPKLFKSAGPAPTETQVLEAIGWQSSAAGGETKNWEDEQWEINEVKDDLKQTMHKGAKEWDKWCKNFEKDPEKALKK